LFLLSTYGDQRQNPLVDDNPMVLGMLQQALSALGEVTVATDAADAFLKAVDDRPEVRICDYRMWAWTGGSCWKT